jgi:AAA domain-containing protein
MNNLASNPAVEGVGKVINVNAQAVVDRIKKEWGCGLCLRMHDEIADPSLRCTTPGLHQIRDWLDDGTTFEQRRRANTAKATKATKVAASTNTLVIKSMGSVTMKKINWLWNQHIPQRKLTIFCGDPGSMKSMVAGDIAARGSAGLKMPDGTSCPEFETLMFVGEDDVDDTTAPRLTAAGGNKNKVHYVEGVPAVDGEMHDVALDEHLGLIRKFLNENPAIRVVVIDPLSNYLGDVKMIDEQLIRKKILTPLKRLAAETGVAAIGVMHLNKKVNLSAINRIGGAMAFVGVARMVWLFIGDSQDPSKRYMLKVKSNIVKNTSGQGFEVVEKLIDIGGEMVDQPVINWTGTTSQSVNQQLGKTSRADEPADESPRTTNPRPGFGTSWPTGWNTLRTQTRRAAPPIGNWGLRWQRKSGWIFRGSLIEGVVSSIS